MQPELKNIKRLCETGEAAGNVIRERTLWLIINELENMCVSTDGPEGIKCDPCSNGAPGFWMHTRAGEGELIYYVQNGDLKAGYFSVVDEPDAPGL